MHRKQTPVAQQTLRLLEDVHTSIELLSTLPVDSNDYLPSQVKEINARLAMSCKLLEQVRAHWRNSHGGPCAPKSTGICQDRLQNRPSAAESSVRVPVAETTERDTDSPGTSDTGSTASRKSSSLLDPINNLQFVAAQEAEMTLVQFRRERLQNEYRRSLNFPNNSTCGDSAAPRQNCFQPNPDESEIEVITLD